MNRAMGAGIVGGLAVLGLLAGASQGSMEGALVGLTVGGLVGLSRENINRQLKAWQKDGMVDLAGGFITITDMGAMEDLAEYYS